MFNDEKGVKFYKTTCPTCRRTEMISRIDSGIELQHRPNEREYHCSFTIDIYQLIHDPSLLKQMKYDMYDMINDLTVKNILEHGKE